MSPSEINKRAVVTAVGAAALVAVVALVKSGSAQPAAPVAPPPPAASNPPAAASVDLTPSQLNAIRIEPVGTALFPEEKEAVGSIEYVDDLSVQVFPPYQGKLLKTFADLGDQVQKGQPLYTIDSPDLVQAESTLIGDAATLDLTTKELQRAKELFSTNVGVSERELEQALNEQQTAEGALNAARKAVRIFGKAETEIDQIVGSRKIDSTLVVASPIAGRVTAFNAPPGQLVQPGAAPAPFTVSDLSVKWMLADVTESDAPLCREGDPVRATILAYPGRAFAGKITKVYPAVDPATHRLTVRCEIPDPTNELRPGMLANFVIQVHAPIESTALPFNGVVRNGDGSLSCWVTTDRYRFTRVFVKIGLAHDGQYQVLDGLQPGQLAVTDGAIFLSNLLEAPPSD